MGIGLISTIIHEALQFDFQGVTTLHCCRVLAEVIVYYLLILLTNLKHICFSTDCLNLFHRQYIKSNYQFFRLRSEDGLLDSDMTTTWNIVVLPKTGFWAKVAESENFYHSVIKKIVRNSRC